MLKRITTQEDTSPTMTERGPEPHHPPAGDSASMPQATPETTRQHPLVQRYIEQRQPDMPSPNQQALCDYVQLLVNQYPHTLQALEAACSQEAHSQETERTPENYGTTGPQPPRLLYGRDSSIFLAWKTLSNTWTRQQKSAVARWTVACLTSSTARTTDARHDPGRNQNPELEEQQDPAPAPGCAMRHPSGIANAAQLHQIRLGLQKHLRRSGKQPFQRTLVALGQLAASAQHHPGEAPQNGCPADSRPQKEAQQGQHVTRTLLLANGHIFMNLLHQADPGLARELEQQASPWRTPTAQYLPASWDQRGPSRPTILRAWRQARTDPGWTDLDASARELSLHLTHHLDRWLHRIQHDPDLELHPLTPHRVHQPAFWDPLMRPAAQQTSRHCQQTSRDLTQALRDQDEQQFHAALDTMQHHRQTLEDTLTGQRSPEIQDQDLLLQHRFQQQLREVILDHALYDRLVAASGSRENPQAPTLYAQSLREPWFNQALADFTHNMQPQEQHDLVKRLLHTAAPELEHVPDPQDILQAPSQPTKG